jgi:hypothetical protein
MWHLFAAFALNPHVTGHAYATNATSQKAGGIFLHFFFPTFMSLSTSSRSCALVTQVVVVLVLVLVLVVVVSASNTGVSGRPSSSITTVPLVTDSSRRCASSTNASVTSTEMLPHVTAMSRIFSSSTPLSTIPLLTAAVMLAELQSPYNTKRTILCGAHVSGQDMSTTSCSQ